MRFMQFWVTIRAPASAKLKPIDENLLSSEVCINDGHMTLILLHSWKIDCGRGSSNFIFRYQTLTKRVWWRQNYKGKKLLTTAKEVRRRVLCESCARRLVSGWNNNHLVSSLAERRVLIIPVSFWTNLMSCSPFQQHTWCVCSSSGVVICTQSSHSCRERDRPYYIGPRHSRGSVEKEASKRCQGPHQSVLASKGRAERDHHPCGLPFEKLKEKLRRFVGPTGARPLAREEKPFALLRC